MLNFKLICVLSCLVAFVAFVTAVPVNLINKGGPRELTGDKLKEAEDVLKESLSKLATGDGPHYTLSKIYTASRQTVSGSLYKYKVDLEDQEHHKKECNVSIWSRPWLENGSEVTFECEGVEKLIKTHSV